MQNCMDGAHCAHMSTKVGYSSMTVLPAILASSLCQTVALLKGPRWISHIVLIENERIKMPVANGVVTDPETSTM